MTLDLQLIRSQFPALKRDAIFLDNPAGTQVAQPVLDRINQYLIGMNANTHGTFATSRESDIILDEARAAAADFLGASRPEEVVFGPNMTSLTFNLSRSLARKLQPGDEIVVTRGWTMTRISPPGRWSQKTEGALSAGWISILKPAHSIWIVWKQPWHINPKLWQLGTHQTP